MEESRNREECNEYDKDLVLAVRQEEEDAKSGSKQLVCITILKTM